MRLNILNSAAPLVIAAIGLFNFSPANAQNAFIDVEYGGDIICAIKDDQSAVCNSVVNIEGRTPTDLQPVIDIAAGNSVACAVLVGGDLRCWGQDAFGLLNSPTSGAPYKAVGTDNSHSCAINKDDGIECWGLDSNDRLEAPEGTFKQLSVSIRQACAVDMNGNVSCWGLNESGSTDVPADLPPAQKVATGAASSCALLVDGSIQCWGRPIRVPNDSTFVDLDVEAYGGDTNGTGGVCGIDANGKLSCAFSRYSAAGIANLNPSSNATPVPSTIGNSKLSMRGATNGCYINSSGTIDCFGFASSEALPQLGDNMPVPETTGLRAEIYSATTIELFWNGPRDAFNVAGYEIQRDGEVFAITQNGSSYFIEDLEEGTTTSFAVRRVNVDGRTGPFSETIDVVTSSPGSEQGGGSNNYEPPVRLFEPAGLQALVYSATALELVWDRPINANIDGYEIRRDGVFIGYTNGTSYYEIAPSADRVYRYDVIPVNREDPDHFYGFSSVSVGLGGSEPGVCL